MTSKPSRRSKWAARALALLLAAGMTLLACGYEAFAQFPPPPPLPSPLPPLPPPPAPLPPPPAPLPPPPPLPVPPLPLPVPPPDLSLAPPELPRIPSLPQIFPPNAPPPSGSTELPVTSARLDAKILVISADGTEPVLGAIRQAADYEGIPYTLYVASKTPGGFTAGMLSDGGAHAFYQGIVLTTGTLAYFNGTTWTSAFNTSEWQTLWDYQAKYRVRTAIAYVYPTADLGFGPATGLDATTSPISAQLTSTGQSVFSYVNAANPIVITKAWTYLAAAAGTGTNVLLGDSQGHALALVRTYPDGRQVLSMTFDGNFFLVHSLVFAHGVMNWVTGGLFLGERHIYMSPQIDDIFIDDDVYGGGSYRITGIDWAANAAWQTLKQQQSQTAGLSLHMAFNGEGTTGTYTLDTLTPTAEVTGFQFPWINHTYSHENLDAASYDVVYQQITRNNEIAASMGFADYDLRALITPDISGLSNPQAMRAAYDAGIRFLVTDTSRPGMDNPTPQAGILNWEDPRILMVPRRPVNLFYNVTTPSEWTNEYNYLYHSYWGRDLTYDEILGKESDVLLQYLLRGEIDPWMFHESNLRAYDAVHSLLGDLLDRTLDKYERLFTLPIRTLSLVGLGEATRNRMQYNAAGVRCSFAPAQGTITITASGRAVVPVTGLCTSSDEVYGGQCISHISLSAGQTVTYSIGSGSQGGVAGVGDEDQTTVLLHQNHPNPFNALTEIKFDLPQSSRVDLKVFDITGRLVRVIASGRMPAGFHVATWDGRDDRGYSVANGVYYYELLAGPVSARRRMVLLR